MTHTLHALELLLLVLGGIVTFRIRGGLLAGTRWQTKGQTSRRIWAAWCVLTVLATGVPWWIAPAFLPLMWLATMEGLSHCMDMGRSRDAEDTSSFLIQRCGWSPFWRDFMVGHLHGLGIAACAAVPLAWMQWGSPGWPGAWEAWRPPAGAFPLWWLGLVGGAAWGAVYALASLRQSWPELVRLRLGRDGSFPEMGEVLFGGEFAAALFFAAGGTI